MKSQNSIEHTLTVETLKGAHHLDWNKLYERKEKELDLLRSLLKDDKHDKNVQAVIQIKEKSLMEMEMLKRSWLTELQLSPHDDYKIVILVQKDE